MRAANARLRGQGAWNAEAGTRSARVSSAWDIGKYEWRPPISIASGFDPLVARLPSFPIELYAQEMFPFTM